MSLHFLRMLRYLRSNAIYYHPIAARKRASWRRFSSNSMEENNGDRLTRFWLAILGVHLQALHGSRFREMEQARIRISRMVSGYEFQVIDSQASTMHAQIKRALMVPPLSERR